MEVPAIVQDYADERILEIALIENIQREDLNPMETAQALERLHTEMNLSHEEIAARTGKDRTTITNMIRLLRLPRDVQLLVAERRLSMGHARAILGLATPELQTQVAEKAAAQGFSVRQVERLVKKVNEPREPSEHPLQDPNIKAAVGSWRRPLGRESGSSRNQISAGGSRSNIIRRKSFNEFMNGLFRLARIRRRNWCRRQDSNLRPADYETAALTT